MDKRLTLTLDYMRRVGSDELTDVELLTLAARMLRSEAERELSEPPGLSSPLMDPVARKLLADLLIEEAGACADHHEPSIDDVKPELCRSELFALAVARAVVYPPAPYDTVEAMQGEAERVYAKLAVPNA